MEVAGVIRLLPGQPFGLQNRRNLGDLQAFATDPRC